MRTLTGAEQYLAEQAMPHLPREEAYERMGHFLDAVALNAQRQPPPDGPTAGVGALIGLGVSALLSVGTTAVRSVLAPRPETNIQQLPAAAENIVTQTGGGSGGVLARSFSEASTFSSIQRAATFEEFVPCLWAHREMLGASADPYRPAGYYGGISATLGLVFSRVKTQATNSVAQLIWVAGEGPINGLQPNTLALGNAPVISQMGPVDATWSEGGGVTVYQRPNGGRIVSADQTFGNSAARDIGNAENQGGPDVFSVPSLANALRQDHSYASTPNDRRFGLYGPMPVHGMARKTPILEATCELVLRPTGEDPPTNNQDADPEDSPSRLAAVWGRNLQFSLRSSVYELNGATVTTPTESAVVPGDLFKYRLSANTDGGDETVTGTRIVIDTTNSDINSNDQGVQIQQSDIAAVVAGIQKQIASARSVGELVRFGSAIARLETIDPANNPFRSKVDENPVGNGITVDYTYRVIRGGTIGISELDYFGPSWSGTDYKPPRWFRESPFQNQPIPSTFKTASTFPQGAQIETTTLALERECMVFEVNYTSNVWQLISAGFPNLRGSLDLEEIAWQAGQQYAGQRIVAGTGNTNTSDYRSGTLPTIYESRVSLFRILWRRQGEDDTQWKTFAATFGFRGKTQQAQNNTLRFIKTFNDKILLHHEPLSSWELRDSVNTPDPIVILEGGVGTAQSVTDGDLAVYFTGSIVTRVLDNFRLNAVEPSRNIGLVWSDPAGPDSAMFDAMGVVAEWQPYGEAQNSMASSPENSVSSVNYITVYDKFFEYSDLAIIGANILSNPGLTSISQASITCTSGTEIPRYLQLDSVGPSHLLPDIARARLTNNRYGLGDRIGSANIDNTAFQAAATYCQDRRYFYDLQQGGVDDVLEWLDTAATQCLLDYGEKNGLHTLVPTLRFDPILTAADGYVGIFSGSSDEKESLEIRTLPYEQLLPLQVSVIYQELRADDSPLNPALFVRERQLTVRRSGTPSNAKQATFRLPGCTNRYHAADYAMWEIRRREVQRRTATLVTFPSVIGVDLLFNFARLYSDYFGQTAGVTGRVNDDGSLSTTRPDLVTAGSYPVVLWDLATAPSAGTLVVAADGTATPTGVLFAFASDTPYSVFQARGVKLRQDGMVEVELLEYPLDESGLPVLTKVWSNTYTSDSEWTFIDG